MTMEIEIGEIRDRFVSAPRGDFTRAYETSEALHDLDIHQVRRMELFVVSKEAGFDAAAR